MATTSTGPPSPPAPPSVARASPWSAAQAALRERLAAISPAVRDGAAAAVVCAVSVAALALAEEPGARPPDLGAYALLLAAAAPLALRHRWPLAALGAVTGVTLASFALGYPGGPVTLPLMAAIYVAAAAGHRRWAWLVTMLFAGVGAAFRASVEQDPLVSVALNSALFVLVALLGDVVYSRRALRQEVRERLRQAEAERDREAQRRVIDERMRIARELHDVMAHTISTMTVQAGVAADSLDTSPEDARAALRTIRGSARQAMNELRATLSLLRDGDQPSPLLPAPGLADLPALIDSVRQEGLRVDLQSSGAAAPALPAATDLTAYRIVQEALTNVVRHARATSVTVTVEQHPDALLVEVADDGHGPDPTSEPGFGLQGMRERAEAVGGHVEAGARPVGGYRVTARLPIAGRHP